MKNKILLKIAVLFFGLISINAQSDWSVPAEAGEMLSVQLFDQDKKEEGKQLYLNACVSCHGTPSQGNFTPMAPPPGDVAEDRFKVQKDGELFYKIQKGRNAMPSFENTFSETEIWSIVAYMRSFHEGYKQEQPVYDGMEIPKLALQLGYDENIDKLVIKVMDEEDQLIEGVSIKAFVKGMFGDHYLGNALTDDFGLAYVDIDANLPGDAQGNVTILIKASKGYSNITLEKRIQAAKPVVNISVIEGRHLWSKAKQAPIWMITIFNLIGFGVWATIIYIVIGLRKIKKLQ